jgi:hypothetical protein
VILAYLSRQRKTNLALFRTSPSSRHLANLFLLVGVVDFDVPAPSNAVFCTTSLMSADPEK